MTKSRVEKNKKLYETLDEEMKNNKGDLYEEKLKAIDPGLDKDIDLENNSLGNDKLVKKSEVKNTSALTVIAKEINGEKVNKNELIKVEEKKESKKLIEEDSMELEDPISFTDKLSVEEILRAKIEQQEKIKNNKRGIKKGPNDATYTPEMMQERIKQHEGVDVRKEARITTKSYKGAALSVLILSLIAILVVGALLIFKVIKL